MKPGNLGNNSFMQYLDLNDNYSFLKVKDERQNNSYSTEYKTKKQQLIKLLEAQEQVLESYQLKIRQLQQIQDQNEQTLAKYE